MEIKDLEPKQGNVDVVGEITDMEPIREFEKFGKSGKVCNATLKDSSGSIKLTLWNEQTDQVDIGDNVKVTNGYVNEWQGQKQLTTGKFGSLEIINKGKKREEPETPAQEDQPEPHTEDEVLEEDIVDEEELEK